jgi:DNA-directed RNA polymerase subunit RPC12/RpoP
MSEAPRRPILKLKNPPPLAVAPKPPTRWKCKPCGTGFELKSDEAADATIRCPACNARLGTVQDFRDGASRVRARRVDG